MNKFETISITENNEKLINATKFQSIVTGHDVLKTKPDLALFS